MPPSMRPRSSSPSASRRPGAMRVSTKRRGESSMMAGTRAPASASHRSPAASNGAGSVLTKLIEQPGAGGFDHVECRRESAGAAVVRVRNILGSQLAQLGSRSGRSQPP